MNVAFVNDFLVHGYFLRDIYYSGFADESGANLALQLRVGYMGTWSTCGLHGGLHVGYMGLHGDVYDIMLYCEDYM